MSKKVKKTSPLDRNRAGDLSVSVNHLQPNVIANYTTRGSVGFFSAKFALRSLIIGKVTAMVDSKRPVSWTF